MPRVPHTPDDGHPARMTVMTEMPGNALSQGLPLWCNRFRRLREDASMFSKWLRVGFASLSFLLLASLAPRALAEDGPKKERTDKYGDPLPPGALARFGTERFRVGERIRQLALSPDAMFVAAYHHDRINLRQGDTVVLLDAATGKEVRRLNMQDHSGECLVFSPDTKLLASADRDAGIRLFDVATGNLVRSFASLGQGTRPVVCFSENGKVLAVGNEGSDNDRIVAWNANSGKELCRLQLPRDPGLNLALSADGAVLATRVMSDPRQNRSSFIQLWDTVANRELRRFDVDEAHRLGILNLALSPNGKQPAIADGGATIRLLEADTGKQFKQFSARSGAGAALAFSRDGQRLAAATRDGGVQVWDLTAGKRLVQSEGPPCQFFGLAFTGKSEVMAAGLSHQAICVWEVSSGKMPGPEGGHQAAVRAVGFLESGKSIISVGKDGIRTWSVARREQLRRQEHRVPVEERPRGLPELFFLSPDGKHLVEGQRFAGMTRLMEAETGREVCTLGGSSGEDAMAAFSADGKTLATLDGWRRRVPRIRVFDLASGQELRSFDAALGDTHCLALAPDGKSLTEATMSQRSPEAKCVIRTWEASSGKEIRVIGPTKGRIHSMAYTPDGTTLATTGPEGTRLWDAAAGVESITLKGGEKGATSNIAFSSDGRLLAVGIADTLRAPAELLVWEVASGTPRFTFRRPHEGDILALAFSPDGRTLITGCADTTMLLWDLAGDSEDDPAVRGALTAKELSASWSDFADSDAAKGFRAMRRLATSPLESIAYVKERLSPVPILAMREREIEKLIADLGDESFEKREQAGRELKRIGKPAKAVLEKTLSAEPEAERRRRIEAILRDMNNPRLTPESIRSIRALELLERLNTPESRELLSKLAKGAPDARLTREAKAALDRLRNP